MGCLKLYSYEEQSNLEKFTFSGGQSITENRFSLFFYVKANHLGNVLNVITDRKIGKELTTNVEDFNTVNMVANVCNTPGINNWMLNSPYTTTEIIHTGINSAWEITVSQSGVFSGVMTAMTGFVSGETYRVEFDVLDMENGSWEMVNLFCSASGTAQIQPITPGHNVFTYTFDGTNDISRIKIQSLLAGKLILDNFTVRGQGFETAFSNTETVYTADVVSFFDYSPYGVVLDQRHGQEESYAYGFQGQLKDDEIKGEGNSVNYTFRMHDPRIGRFFAVDPLAAKYPHYTPYSFSGNKVIAFVELEGLEEIQYQDKIEGTYYQTGTTSASNTSSYVQDQRNALKHNFGIEGNTDPSETWRITTKYDEHMVVVGIGYERWNKEGKLLNQHTTPVEGDHRSGKYVTDGKGGWLKGKALYEHVKGKAHARTQAAEKLASMPMPTNPMAQDGGGEVDELWLAAVTSGIGTGGASIGLADDIGGTLVKEGTEQLIKESAEQSVKLISQFSSKTIDEAVEYAMNPRKLEHIFEKEAHNLAPLVEKLGGQKNTLQAVLNAANGKLPSSGVFNDIPVNVSGFNVYIRGSVIDGVPKLGTMFIR